MKKIGILIIILITIVSCKDKYILPTEYSCFKFNEADSIIKNYMIEDKSLEFEEFSTLFGFKLCANKEVNKYMYQKYINENKIRDSLIYINERIKPFYVRFEKFNNKICEISFHSFERYKFLKFPDYFLFSDEKEKLIEKAKKELEIEINGKGYNLIKNEKQENLQSNFNNLLSSLTKKYGKYNFSESNDYTESILNTKRDDIKYQKYYWIINNTLITLKYEYLTPTRSFKDYEGIEVKTILEDIYLVYENITLNKKRNDYEIDVYNNKFKKQYEKENAKKINYEKSKDSLDSDDQTEINKNL